MATLRPTKQSTVLYQIAKTLTKLLFPTALISVVHIFIYAVLNAPQNTFTLYKLSIGQSIRVDQSFPTN